MASGGQTAEDHIRTLGLEEALPGSNSIEFRVSDTTSDEPWDRFVEGTPFGSHIQTSTWATLKSTIGVPSVRVTAHESGAIIGGAQALLNKAPMVGRIAYVPRGPVVARDDNALRMQIVERVRTACWDAGARHLTIQPPSHGTAWSDVLSASGFGPSDQSVAPVSTLLVDLEADEEEMLRRMRKSTRYKVRHSGRSGVVVREGTRADLDALVEMLDHTAERQGFSAFPLGYYADMWDLMEPKGHLRMTIVELDGSPVAGQLAVGFGDTVVNKVAAWGGEGGKAHPNEALHWNTMLWAKENGYRTYDLEGVEADIAQTYMSGAKLPDEARRTVSFFKLGFGGSLHRFPGPMFDAPNKAIRWAYGHAYPRISQSKIVKSAIAAARTRTH